MAFGQSLIVVPCREPSAGRGNRFNTTLQSAALGAPYGIPTLIHEGLIGGATERASACGIPQSVMSYTNSARLCALELIGGVLPSSRLMMHCAVMSFGSVKKGKPPARLATRATSAAGAFPAGPLSNAMAVPPDFGKEPEAVQ